MTGSARKGIEQRQTQVLRLDENRHGLLAIVNCIYLDEERGHGSGGDGSGNRGTVPIVVYLGRVTQVLCPDRSGGRCRSALNGEPDRCYLLGTDWSGRRAQQGSGEGGTS